MKAKNDQALQLYRHGKLSSQEAVKITSFALQEMAKGKQLDSQMHTSETETLFVFIANGICATLHIQEFNPILAQEGGEA